MRTRAALPRRYSRAQPTNVLTDQHPILLPLQYTPPG
jgi:hypothetical protein